jgi:DNA helicase-2/ATP-dependent DNA helicase PcrA
VTSLLEGLNDQQHKAATHFDGPLVVFAGAGSGKTRIITTRIAHLIENGVMPWEILAVTFTNKAAGEMRERVISLCPQAKRTMVTTFHSACARWLREFATELGYTASFTIYDDKDSTAALKKIIKDANPKADLPSTVAEMRSFIHFAKTQGFFPQDVERFANEHPKLVPLGGVSLYQRYQEFLADCNAMDFGDLLLNMLLLLRRNEAVRSILTKRYQYILVDEFQDTNKTQFEIVSTLASNHQNLFVVGDDDQSIYSWRGATPANIIDFDKSFPTAKKVALEQNYRCTGNIVKAASQLIANNTTRAPKTLFTKAEAGSAIDVHIESDGEMEAWWVANQIKTEKTAFPHENVAIFYRTNSQSRPLEEALIRANIPYTIFGSVEFYDRAEIKDLMAYLKLMVNEKDEVSLRRIINVPTRGIGQKAVEAIANEAKNRGISMYEAVVQLANEGMPRVGPKLRYFVDLMTALKKDILSSDLDDAVGILLEALEYNDYLKKKYPDQYTDKLDNIHELSSGMAEFAKREEEANLESWLQSVTLIRENSDQSDDKKDSPGVTMMTLHMAKGLEFPRVYLVGVEEGLLPHRNSLGDQTQIEEERRLLYVGITRSKEKLSLLAAKRRRTFQSFTSNSPSRFFKELPGETLDISLAASIELRQQEANHQDLDDDPLGFGQDSLDADAPVYEYDYSDDTSASELVKGARVYHPTYGSGMIEDFENRFGQVKAVVRFSEFGLRKIRTSQLSLQKSKF